MILKTAKAVVILLKHQIYPVLGYLKILLKIDFYPYLEVIN